MMQKNIYAESKNGKNYCYNCGMKLYDDFDIIGEEKYCVHCAKVVMDSTSKTFKGKGAKGKKERVSANT